MESFLFCFCLQPTVCTTAAVYFTACEWSPLTKCETVASNWCPWHNSNVLSRSALVSQSHGIEQIFHGGISWEQHGWESVFLGTLSEKLMRSSACCCHHHGGSLWELPRSSDSRPTAGTNTEWIMKLGWTFHIDTPRASGFSFCCLFFFLTYKMSCMLVHFSIFYIIAAITVLLTLSNLCETSFMVRTIKWF